MNENPHQTPGDARDDADPTRTPSATPNAPALRGTQLRARRLFRVTLCLNRLVLQPSQKQAINRKATTGRTFMPRRWSLV